MSEKMPRFFDLHQSQRFRDVKKYDDLKKDQKKTEKIPENLRKSDHSDQNSKVWSPWCFSQRAPCRGRLGHDVGSAVAAGACSIDVRNSMPSPAMAKPCQTIQIHPDSSRFIHYIPASEDRFGICWTIRVVSCWKFFFTAFLCVSRSVELASLAATRSCTQRFCLLGQFRFPNPIPFQFQLISLWVWTWLTRFTSISSEHPLFSTDLSTMLQGKKSQSRHVLPKEALRAYQRVKWWLALAAS